MAYPNPKVGNNEQETMNRTKLLKFMKSLEQSKLTAVPNALNKNVIKHRDPGRLQHGFGQRPLIISILSGQYLYNKSFVNAHIQCQIKYFIILYPY